VDGNLGSGFMADVRLVDLEVIKRYSLAIRQESAPAAELLAALDASRAHVLSVMTARRPARPTARPTARSAAIAPRRRPPAR
jgi:hypothetical protein